MCDIQIVSQKRVNGWKKNPHKKYNKQHQQRKK